MVTIFRKKAKGFTLIELLIVVAIIGILAAIAIPNLLQAQRRSKNSRGATDSKQIVTQIELFTLDNNCLPSKCVPAMSTTDPSFLWNKGAPGATVYMAQTRDPWGSAGAVTVGTNYFYTDQVGGVQTALTSEIRAWGRGSNTTNDSYTIDDIGYSSYSGGFNSPG